MAQAKGPLSLRSRLRGAIARGVGRLPRSIQTRLSGRPPIEVDGQTLDPALSFLLSLRRPGLRTPLSAGTPAAARARFLRELLVTRGRPTRVRSVRDLKVPGGDEPLEARLYLPSDRRGGQAPPPLLVFFHGGGFMLGDVESHDECCRLLCRHGGAAVLSVAYRLAPEHPYPAAIEDALASFRWAQANAAELGADPERVGVGGDSAGGNLAAIVAQRTALLDPPAGQLLIYPSTDLTISRPSHQLFDDGFFLSLPDCAVFRKHYFGESRPDRADPAVSPLRAPDLSGLAPTLVVTAGFDVLRDEGIDYAKALSAAGTECELQHEPTLGHGFVLLTHVCPAARQATVEMAHRWSALVARAGRPV
jgi:acetyl esterase